MSILRHFFISSSVKFQKKKYSKLYAKFGHALKSLHWSSTENQKIRFEIMFSLLKKLEAKSFLDVGCGFGDFQEFLDKNGANLTYHGIDQVKGFVEQAIISKPEANWIQSDFLEYDFKGQFDVVGFCGTFAFGNQKFFESGLRKAFKLARRAVIFNLYRAKNKDFFYRDKQQVFSLASAMGFKRMEVQEAYHPFDRTYCLYVE